MNADDLGRLLERGDASAVAEALAGLPENRRRALAPRLRAADPPPSKRDADRWAGALRVAGAACLPRAADVVAWLRSPRFRPAMPAATVAAIVRMLSLPGRPRFAAVAGGLAAELRVPEIEAGHWALVAATLRAGRLTPPATEAMVRGWVRERSGGSVRTLAVRLATDDWLPALLPEVFAQPGVAAELDETWPPALARLAADGTVDRAGLIDLLVARLLDGDRAAALRPALATYRLLDPDLAEQYRHRSAYLDLLAGRHLGAAELAQHALRSLDEAGRLEPDSVRLAGVRVLARTDKKLTRGQLSWLDDAAARHPGHTAPLLQVVATALTSPSVDVAERSLRVLERHPGGLDVLRDATAELSGYVRRLADEALGAGPAVAEPRPPIVFVPERMPGPIVPVAPADTHLDPVELEQLLAGVAAHPDRSRALRPLLDALAGTPTAPPQEMLLARIRELAAGSTPVLLATPHTRDGHVDPARVLFRLAEAEQDGWRPGPCDLTQALLRLPREVDGAVLAAADRLASPAGRRFAGWLRHGGLPDPATAVAGPEHDAVTWAPLDAVGLSVPAGLLSPPSGRDSTGADTSYWPMVLPSHREIIAAHLLPAASGAAAVLPDLARCTGPFGPAMALLLAETMIAGQDRPAVAGALSHLAATGQIDPSLLAGELIALSANGLGDVPGVLADLTRDGDPHLVWSIGRELVPVLLRRAHPPTGLPDLLAVVTAAAAAIGARETLPEVDAAAAAPGRTRLRTEATRLSHALT
ncbi:MAG: hypothetical protein ABW046_10345 [Actinoplanes sp.]